MSEANGESTSPGLLKNGIEGSPNKENVNASNIGNKKTKSEAPPAENSGHKKVKTEASSSANTDPEVVTDVVSLLSHKQEPKKIKRRSFYKSRFFPGNGQNGNKGQESFSPERDDNEPEKGWKQGHNSSKEGPGRQEPLSPEMEILMLEAALQRWDQKHKVQGVLSIIKERAVPRGENFLSIVTRLTVKVVLGSGRHATRRFILKEIPKDEITRNICKNSGIFKLETNTYRILLKEMEYLMAEFGDTDDVLWCQLIKYDPYTTILLEDLTDFGFRTVKRQACLDLDHGLLAIRNLARFHAMAKVLQGRGIINESENIPYSLINHPGIVKSFFFKGYEAVSKGIKKYWGKEWEEIADSLRLPLDYLQDKMLDIGKLVDNRFYVLNHGDCWSNNLMFKYDWNNKPIAVRFLDFQAPHYNSPAIDLTYFLHQSMEPSVRRSEFKKLLMNYYQSLVKTFQKYEYTDPILTFEELVKEMERVSFFGLSMFIIRHAVVTTDMDDAMDLEKIFLTEGEEGLNIDIYKDLSLIPRMGPDLKFIVDEHAR